MKIGDIISLLRLIAYVIFGLYNKSWGNHKKKDK